MNRPPSSWFQNPGLTGPTAIEITDEGRIFGHAALFGTCHISNPRGPGVCVEPPRSGSDYAYFHLGSVRTEEGDTLSVGQITLDAPHAPLKLGLADASRHYDHTGSCVADVRCGEDSFGIWVAGALRPEVDEEKIAALQAAKLSGDWRNMRGSLELVGLLAVNVPGFPVPRLAVRASATANQEMEDPRLALVAAGIVETLEPSPEVRRRVLAARARGGVSALAALARGQ